MDFNLSQRSTELQAKLLRFMDDYIYPCLLYTSPSPRD